MAVPWAVAVEAGRTICVDFDVGAVVGRVARAEGAEGVVDPTMGVVVVVVELGVEEGAGGVEAKVEVVVEAEAIVGAGAEAAAEGVETAPEPPETPDIGLAILAATPAAKLGAKTAAIDKGLENSPSPMPSLSPAIVTTKQRIATGSSWTGSCGFDAGQGEIRGSERSSEQHAKMQSSNSRREGGNQGYY